MLGATQQVRFDGVGYARHVVNNGERSPCSSVSLRFAVHVTDVDRKKLHKTMLLAVVGILGCDKLLTSAA